MKWLFLYEKRIHITYLVLSCVVFIWAMYKPLDVFGWFMLMLPALIIVICLVATYKKYQFTTLTYSVVLVHIVILLIGAKYTYTHNPLFDELTPIFGFARNHFDRVGHFFQGFAPVLMVREFMLRRGYMKKSKFFYLTVIFFVLAISASWELLEFICTVITNKPAEYVLSTQGDMWDSHMDMLLAIIGALSSLVIFSKLQDKEIERHVK